MKAAVISTPGAIAVREVPEPVLHEYDALCDIVSASVCCGTDNNILNADPYHGVHPPTLLGHESIGRVREIGPKVQHYKKGDLVTRVFNRMPPDSDLQVMYGAFSERGYVTDWQAMREDGLPEKVWKPYTVHRVIPEESDPVASLMLITWRETLSFVRRMHLEKGMRALVIGSGGNALAFVEHGAHIGLISAAVGTAARLDDFRAAGAQIALDYKSDTLRDDLKKSGFANSDLIIDAVGAANTANTLLPLLRDQGRFALYGLNDFANYALNLTAAGGDVQYFNGEHYDEGSAHEEIMGLLKRGKLDAWRYLSRQHIYPLEDIAQALAACRNRAVYKSALRISA